MRKNNNNNKKKKISRLPRINHYTEIGISYIKSKDGETVWVTVLSDAIWGLHILKRYRPLNQDTARSSLAVARAQWVYCQMKSEQRDPNPH